MKSVRHYAGVAYANLAVIALLAGISTATGCRTLSGAGLTEAKLAAATGDADLNDWSKLTDDQKKQAHWKLTRAFYDVLLDTTNAAIPDRYKTDPWAKTIKAETAPVGTGAK